MSDLVTIKKGNQKLELTMNELTELVHEVVDPPAGKWEHYRILGIDVDLTPRIGKRTPKRGDEYTLINIEGKPLSCQWTGCYSDQANFELCNAFWSEAEATKEARRRKAEYRLKQIAEEAWANSDNKDRSNYWCLDYYDSDDGDINTSNPWDSVHMPGAETINFPDAKSLRESFKTNKQDWLDWLMIKEGK